MMTGPEIVATALALNAQIVAKFGPSLEAFENLEFSAQPARVVVWPNGESVEFENMAVVALPG